MRLAIPVLAGLLGIAGSSLAGQAADVASFRVAPPSPTAASLGKFGDVPVSMYTGTPDISIPLFNLKGKTLDLPIGLKYHAGGIKVEEIGGWVGIGWALEAGGVITRTVRGVPDDEAHGYLTTGSQLYNQSNWTSTLFDNLRNESADGEPDQYFFDFAGQSGKFVMGPTDVQGTLTIRTIPYRKMRILPLLSGGAITGFVITTEDGTRYTFGNAESTQDMTMNSSGTFNTNPFHDFNYNSSWFLTKIQSVGGDVITLNYAPYTVRHRMGTSEEAFDLQDYVGSTPCVPTAPYYVYNEYQLSTWYVTSISSAAYTVFFYPGTDLRTDAPNSSTGALQEPRLDHITVVTPSGTVIRRFFLTQDYSTGRLTLKSVAEADPSGNLLPPYTFAYSGTLPDRNSTSVDWWGFYNARNNVGLVAPLSYNGVALSGANRTPSADAADGILTRITYPTGGYDTFTYEANDYGSLGSMTPLTVDSTVGTGVGSVEGSTTFSISSNNTLVIVSTLQSPGDCTGQFNPPCPFTQILDANGNNVDSWQFANKTDTITLQAGAYTLVASANGSPGGWSQINITWVMQVSINALPIHAKKGGGLRVAEVDAVDAMGQTTVHKYKYRLEADSTWSSGVVDFEPTFWTWYTSPYCSYVERSSMSKLPPGDGPAVAYREVAEWFGANAEYGKTVHHFRSPYEFPDPAPTAWALARHTSYEFKRGQEAGTRVYNASGQLQRRDTSSYTISPDTSASRTLQGISMEYFTGGGTQDGFGQTLGVYVWSPFSVLSNWIYLNSDTTVKYDQTGTNAVTSARNFVYGNPKHLQLTELTETNSDGTQRVTRMTYPLDYGTDSGSPETAALAAMQDTFNLVNPVVEKWVIRRVNGIDVVAAGSLTTYKVFGPGQILPYQHFVLTNPGVIQ